MSRTFLCKLLISNSMVSRGIWINMHSWVFQRPQIALVLWTRAILRSLKNTLVHVISKLHLKPCYLVCVLWPDIVHSHKACLRSEIFWRELILSSTLSSNPKSSHSVYPQFSHKMLFYLHVTQKDLFLSTSLPFNKRPVLLKSFWVMQSYACWT